MRSPLALVACAVAVVALVSGCSAAPAGDEAAEESMGAATMGVASNGWVGLYGTESSQFIMALQVSSAEPFVFAISASRQNREDITVDAANLTGTYDDASKMSVTFTRGDCTLKLAKTAGGIGIQQQGRCTSIGVPTEMRQINGTTLERETGVCWDSHAKSFAVPGTCPSTPGFDSAALPPKPWKGLYGTESTQFIMALNVSSEEPLVFALSASRQNLEGITADADGLEATYDDESKSSATFERGDCTLKLTRTERGLAVAQSGACSSIGVPADMTLDGEPHPINDMCWDSGRKSFRFPGMCKASPGF